MRPMPAANSPARCAVARGSRDQVGDLPHQPRATSCTSPDHASARAPDAGGLRRRAPGLRYGHAPRPARGRAARSSSPTPAIPSTMQWWILKMSAHRSSSRPSDQPRLPQGAVAVEGLRHEPAHELVQRRRRPRGRQRGVPHVVVEVEVRVVDPDRSAQLERARAGPAGGSGGSGGAWPRSGPGGRPATAARPSERAHPGDVHVRRSRPPGGGTRRRACSSGPWRPPGRRCVHHRN